MACPSMGPWASRTRPPLASDTLVKERPPIVGPATDRFALRATYSQGGADTRIRLDPGGAVWRTRRGKDGWEAWTCLGGVGYVHIDVFEDAKAAVQLFALAESGRIYRLSRGL